VCHLIKDMGMTDWHTNVLLELIRITRDGYLADVSSAVKKVTKKSQSPSHSLPKIMLLLLDRDYQ
jgi:hypothetical protein